MSKRAMTLVELLITLALAGIIFLAIFHVSTLAGKQINVYIERYNAYDQIGYALDDMALRLPSASRIYNPFNESGVVEIQDSMHFFGWLNPYNVTPYAGDTEYIYRIKDNALVLEDITHDRTETLVEAKFEPTVEFVRHGDAQDIEPNFMTVIVTANCNKSASIGLPTRVVKAEGIKFWFIDVVAPR